MTRDKLITHRKFDVRSELGARMPSRPVDFAVVAAIFDEFVFSHALWLGLTDAEQLFAHALDRGWLEQRGPNTYEWRAASVLPAPTKRRETPEIVVDSEPSPSEALPFELRKKLDNPIELEVLALTPELMGKIELICKRTALQPDAVIEYLVDKELGLWT